MRHILGLDIGSNSVGSAWIDTESGDVTTGVSVFPAGVDEADDKRGEPKNAKRRMMRRARITLARRAERKRQLRVKLIDCGLLPMSELDFKTLLENTDPWDLRRRGLDEALTPHEFGRVLLHLAQRRGALGLKIDKPEEGEEQSAESVEDGKVKAAITEVRAKMDERRARTFGEFIAMVRDERVMPITSKDSRPLSKRSGPREWCSPVRNKAASYEHCADRKMIRDEFAKLWKVQSDAGSATARLLTDKLRLALDNPEQDNRWRHKGLLFGQRATNWDLGSLGRCSLEPSERCVPHADMYASRYRVIETVNNLKIRETGKRERPLTEKERDSIVAFLSGPLGQETRGKRKGQPKRTVSVTDLRNFMGTSKDGWGRATKTSRFRFNIESDDDRSINTDWFNREIVHGAIGADAWATIPENLKEGFNRAILRHDPDDDDQEDKLRAGVMTWGGLDGSQADALVAVWKGRPRPDAKRLNMSRRAVRNLLTVMDQPWPDKNGLLGYRWPTQIEARKRVAGNAQFRDVTTEEPLDDVTRRRYATGAKGATARDRYYMNKHVLMKDGKEVIDKATGEPLAEPPPAPLVSNPVVRKAIHEVRRHVIEYMLANERKPDAVYIELAREAKMGKKAADRLLFRNRLRNRIRNDIIETHSLHAHTSTQQREAVDRVVLCVQQDGVCPLCGNDAVNTKITPRMAAEGSGCEIAHIIPRASGGHNGHSNIVLSHTRCNREMGRRTPRELWEGGVGFDGGMRWVEGIFGGVKRPKPSEVKNVQGPPLWACYFNARDDQRKIERFKKNVSDDGVQGFTERQAAATTYAARQVMAYLSDALFDGNGLTERATGSGEPQDARRIFASKGMWTNRLRREWGLFFDSHGARSQGLEESEEAERKEKNRGDHHHHAIDAAVIALTSRHVQIQWERREKAGDDEYWRHVKSNGNEASYKDWMENYRRNNRLRPPAPFEHPGVSVDEAIKAFRAEVKRAVFGEDGAKPICHRPVKRKLIGSLHKETLRGPVLDPDGELTGHFTARKSVIELSPKHLRLPRTETQKEAIERLAARRQREKGVNERAAKKWARSIVTSPGYKPAIIDPPPGKTGIVRDRALRVRLRECLEENSVDPESFGKGEIKKLHEAGRITQTSGVPIHSAVLLWTMNDPVIIARGRTAYGTSRLIRADNLAVDSAPSGDPGDADGLAVAQTAQRTRRSLRAYDSQNNHHIEIRENPKGKWSCEVVTAYDTAQRKLAKLRAMKDAGVPKPAVMRKMSKAERRRWRPVIAQIEAEHTLVNRSDNDDGRFVMSLCEGEMLWMKNKATGELDYLVVAEIEKAKKRVIVVPHWDARRATARKNAEGKQIPRSKRDEFAATPSDLKELAPPGEPHARKVYVTPLGIVTLLDRD